MELVARYRGQLLAAAITPRAADLLFDEVGVVEIRGGVRVDTHIVLPAAPISGSTLAGRAIGAFRRRPRIFLRQRWHRRRDWRGRAEDPNHHGDP